MDTQALSEAVRDLPQVCIAGSGSKAWLAPVSAGSRLSILGHTGIVELHAEDQVVVVRAGTIISDLQRELAPYGLCVPLPNSEDTGDAPAGLPGTVGGGVAMNLPHALEGATGNWRDWVLGLTVIRPDGTVAKCGSKAVKNVAGYDVARLIVGSRGELCVVSEAILKLYPLRALPRPSLVGRAHWGPVKDSRWVAVVRTMRTDLESFLRANDATVQAHDPETATVWLSGGEGTSIVQAAQAVVWSSQGGVRPSELDLRTKKIFDPANKLNKRPDF